MRAERLADSSKLLFAQKMWNHCLPQLIEGDKEASGRDRLPYLVAFSSLLPLIPASICLSDLPTVSTHSNLKATEHLLMTPSDSAAAVKIIGTTGSRPAQ